MFMVTTPDIAEQQDRALARLLEMGLAAAEKVQARLMATEKDALLGELSLALNRASRNVRQTIALQMRAARDRRLEAREIEAEAGPADEARRAERRKQVKAAVEQLIWDERERPDVDAELRVRWLNDDLLDYARSHDFSAETVEVHIARLCARIGIGPGPAATPAAGRADLAGVDAPRRSSA